MTGPEAIQRKRSLLEELAEIDEQLDALRMQDHHVARAADLHWDEYQNPHTGDVPLRHAEAVGPQLGFNIYTLRASFLEIPPRSEEGNYHRHGEVIKLYLNGAGKERVGDKVYEVAAGDVAFTPANAWHSTQNDGDEPVRIFQVSQALGAPLQVPVIRAYSE